MHIIVDEYNRDILETSSIVLTEIISGKSEIDPSLFLDEEDYESLTNSLENINFFMEKHGITESTWEDFLETNDEISEEDSDIYSRSFDVVMDYYDSLEDAKLFLIDGGYDDKDEDEDIDDEDDEGFF